MVVGSNPVGCTFRALYEALFGMQEVNGSSPVRSSLIRYRNTCRAASLSQDLGDLIPQFDAQILFARADEDSAEQRVVHLLPCSWRCSEVSRVRAIE